MVGCRRDWLAGLQVWSWSCFCPGLGLGLCRLGRRRGRLGSSLGLGSSFWVLGRIWVLGLGSWVTGHGSWVLGLALLFMIFV